MTIGEELLGERRRRRRAGDPRLSAEGREMFRRMATGDLADEFQAALDGDLADDPLRAATGTTTTPDRLIGAGHDEYLAVRVLGGIWPEELPDDDLPRPPGVATPACSASMLLGAGSSLDISPPRPATT